MERSLLQWSLVLGLAGGACTLWVWRLLREEDRARPLPGLLPVGAALLLAAVVFVITLPEGGIFRSGQGLGRGFMLGTLAALLLVAALRLGAGVNSGTRRLLALALAFFTAAALAAIPQLWMRATVIDVLCGAALGWLAVVVLQLGLNSPESGEEHELVVSAGLAVTLLSLVALGIYRDFLTPELTRGTWGAVATAAALAPALSLLLCAVFPVRVLPWILVPVLTLGLLAVLSLHLLNEPNLVWVGALGLAGAIACRWMTAPRQPGALAAGGLVVLACTMTSFILLQGYGVGFWVLLAFTATAYSGAREDDERSSASLLNLLFMGVLLLLYRLLTTRFRVELRGASLTDHYALLSVVAGVLLPTLAAGIMGRGELSLWWRWARCKSAALLLLGVPAALIIMWGMRCAPALMIGATLAALGLRPADEEDGGVNQARAALWALVLGVALVQWSERVLPLGDLPRTQKMMGLVGLLFILLIAYAVGSWHERRAQLQPAAEPA